jgi:hypothetical protein
MSSTNISNPKSCNYGCGTRIYWDTVENIYLEVFTKKKHICPNRSTFYNKKSVTSSTTNTTTATKPTYYNNKKLYYSSNQPKPKMSNSFELFQGPIA